MQTSNDTTKETDPNNRASRGWMMRFVRIFCGGITGRDIRRMRELEAVMRYWHNEESTALARAQEAIACGNIERADMWAKRCREARMRCIKDYRKPMIDLTGKPNLFDANANVDARIRAPTDSES